MPKKLKSESVFHPWVHSLTFQMQALLTTAMRGPDNSRKHNPAKAIIRYLRGCVLKPAGNWRGQNDNDFMWGDYKIFTQWSGQFWEDHDEYPHHFLMHLIHCAQVVGYHHPDNEISRHWKAFYYLACHSFHMCPEKKEDMDKRLDDFGCGYKPRKRERTN